MRIGKHLATSAVCVALLSAAALRLGAGAGTVRSAMKALITEGQDIPPAAPASAYGMDVPLAYYNLSFTL